MEPSMRTITASMPARPAPGTGRQAKRRILSYASWTSALVLATLGLGLAQTIVTSRSMNPDGMSYLDLGDYIARHDPAAINGYWSPFYPLIEGVVLRLVHPSIRWEIPLVHATNFAIFVVVFAVFQICWRQMRIRRSQPKVEESLGIGVDPWTLLGLALFAWVSLDLITLEVVSPDLCLVGTVLVAATLLDSIRHEGSWQRYGLLGFVLGMGYLFKAVMFPLAFVFLAASLFCSGSVPKALPRVLLALIIFVAICGPWILVLSKQKGYLTYGLTGKLNYIWFDNSSRPWITGVHHTGRDMPHAPQIVFENPVVYAYPGPAKGSYPFWFDPSYWSEGLTTHFDAGRQLHVLTFNLREELFHIAPEQYIFLAFVLLFLFLSPGVFGRNFLREWHLWLPGLCGIVLYSLVHVETRLTAPFLLLIFAAAFLAVARNDSHYGKLLAAVALVASVLVALSLIDQIKTGQSYSSRSANLNEAVANALRHEGLRAGDRVGLIGDSYRAYWLRLARLSIAAEITPSEASRFWASDPVRQTAVLQAFAHAGARAIVSDHRPPPTSAGWRPLGNTQAHIYLLDRYR
jgi:hypothetical protein